jgi:hypothetical protein
MYGFKINRDEDDTIIKFAIAEGKINNIQRVFPVVVLGNNHCSI